MNRFILAGGLLVLLLTSYSNCGGSDAEFPSVKGTEIGNPMNPTTATPQAVQSTEVLDAACVTLVRCNPGLTLSRCEGGLLQAPNVTAALGLPGGTYPSLSAAQSAEAQGTVSVNSMALSNCLSDLSSLSCSSPNVVNAYVAAPDVATAFANGAQIFPSNPGSCPNLYN